MQCQFILFYHVTQNNGSFDLKNRTQFNLAWDEVHVRLEARPCIFNGLEFMLNFVSSKLLVIDRAKSLKRHDQ